MEDDTYIDLTGRSGSTYRYWFLIDPTNGGTIKDEGGNYAFLKQLADGKFLVLYLGEAKSLQVRIPGHECWPEARRLGVTHVVAHTKPAGEQARCDEERDLIQRWNPSLNVQHRTTG